MNWPALVAQAERVVAPGRDAIRLANLVIAAQTAAQRGYFRKRGVLGGAALADAIGELALGPIVVERDRPAWDALAVEGRAAARRLGPYNAMDAWVQAFQGGDAVRKSRGAYATPQELARPMARLLLKTPDLPQRVLDPSAGAGGLLLAVLRELHRSDPTGRPAVHARRLFGVELDPVARELCCLMIWLACEGEAPIRAIGANIVCDNAITRDWWKDEPYDAVVMNPPWDSLRHDPESDGSDLQREATIARLSAAAPGAPGLPPLYSAHGRGDRNLYKAFVELVPHLVAEGGRAVLLLPGAWSSDLGTRELRLAYLEQFALEQWTSFENLNGYFPIDGRYKFGVLSGVRSSSGTPALQTRAFAADAKTLFRRHVNVPRSVLEEIGGDAAAIPDVTSAQELAVMRQFRRSGIPFFDPQGPFGSVKYVREVDLTVDRLAGHFDRTEELDVWPTGDGTWTTADGRTLVPLLEGRMVGQYDFHQKTWVSGRGRTANWSYANGSRLVACSPQYLTSPAAEAKHRIAICDVTSATNTRTMLATWVPPTWRCGNTAPVLVFETERYALATLAVLNTMVFDWQVRRHVAGLHLNRFYLAGLSWPKLDPATVDELAAIGAALQMLTPRYSDLVEPKIDVRPLEGSYVELHARAEAAVAQSFRLSAKSLRIVYSNAMDDRRGFWRHFASDPHASVIAAQTIARLSAEVQADAPTR
jgi:predicted RNA methylase